MEHRADSSTCLNFMPQRTIPVISKLTIEVSEQPWFFGHAMRISVLDPTQPPHHPCHIFGTTEGLVYTHGTEAIALPWDVLRQAVESVHPKMKAPPLPKPEEIKQKVEAAISEASKLPPTT